MGSSMTSTGFTRRKDMMDQLAARTARNAQKGKIVHAFREGLGAFETAETLSAEQRHQVADTFIDLIEGLYVHLPLKRAMYGKDPVQRLRLLRQRSGAISGSAFHAELSTILTDLRDAHTRYVGPDDLKGKVAVLPFMVETFGPSDAPRFIVSNVIEADDLIPEDFVPGVEVLWWNGVPIERAVESYSDKETGGRSDARRARALESLTFRALQYGLPHHEYWLHIGYRTLDGVNNETRIDWRVVDTSRPGEAETAATHPEAAFAADPAAEAVRRAKKLLFAPSVWYEHHMAAATPVDLETSPAEGEWITGVFQDSVAAKVVDVDGSRFGYLRLWSFDLTDDDGFIAEVVDLLHVLPNRGLIIDLRGNPGGLIWAAERLLQLFTPHEISPVGFSMLATDLTRAMAEAPQNQTSLEPWRRTLRTAVANGEPYSRSVRLTPPSLCNNIGQYYGGPVVAVVDANTYSAGDLFAAGFVDNRVGTLVSIGEATGAGGANVWSPPHVHRALAGTEYPIKPLPNGIGYTISFRRAVRSGSAGGGVIEDVGIPGHFRYEPTLEDLTSGNTGLIAFCAALLASETLTNLTVELTGAATLRISATGLDLADVYVDGHPNRSIPLVDEPIRLELPAGWSTVRVDGYSGETLRQRRSLSR